VSGFGDDVYQPDPADRLEIDQLDDSDTLVDGVGDPLDEGYSPLDRPIGLRGVESFDERLADELPEVSDGDGDGLGDTDDTDGELLDDEVGAQRSGRLVAPNEGFGEDDTSDMVARDVGIDGAGASAEEAAMHVVDGEEELGDRD
jgi:hypothetical protein